MSVRREDVVVGAEFLIVRDVSSHGFEIGSVVRITEVNRPSWTIQAKGYVPIFGRDTQRWVGTQDLDYVVTDEDVRMAIESIKRVQQ